MSQDLTFLKLEADPSGPFVVSPNDSGVHEEDDKASYRYVWMKLVNDSLQAETVAAGAVFPVQSIVQDPPPFTIAESDGVSGGKIEIYMGLGDATKGGPMKFVSLKCHKLGYGTNLEKALGWIAPGADGKKSEGEMWIADALYYQLQVIRVIRKPQNLAE